MNAPSIKQQSVFLPLMMSFIALLMVLVHFAVYGLVVESDEGTAAHIFQLLMVVQIPFISFLAFGWLALAPRKTLLIIALQVSTALTAIVAVFVLTT